MQVYAAPILFERNAYDVPVFTRVHDFMWSGAPPFRDARVFLHGHLSLGLLLLAGMGEQAYVKYLVMFCGSHRVQLTGLPCAVQPWRCRTWPAPCSWASRSPTTPCPCRCWSTSSSGTPTRTPLGRTSTCLSRPTSRRRDRWGPHQPA